MSAQRQAGRFSSTMLLTVPVQVNSTGPPISAQREFQQSQNMHGHFTRVMLI
jgi:hypothetical protein